MFIDSAFVTTMNAQEVADIIHHYYETGSRNYFKLEVTISKGTRFHWIRPLLTKEPYSLENVSQIVMCETDTGESLSLLIPRRQREFMPATAVFAHSTASAG
jgi:hypothetical protein